MVKIIQLTRKEINEEYKELISKAIKKVSEEESIRLLKEHGIEEKE